MKIKSPKTLCSAGYPRDEQIDILVVSCANISMPRNLSFVCSVDVFHHFGELLNSSSAVSLVNFNLNESHNVLLFFFCLLTFFVLVLYEKKTFKGI